MHDQKYAYFATIFVSFVEINNEPIYSRMKAYVFPGQGAQFPGMGKDMYEENAEAKEHFEYLLTV